MEIELRTAKSLDSVAKRTKPVDYFKKCPKCGKSDLIHLNPDVLCSVCDWDSCSWDVSRGVMDNLKEAAREVFKIKPALVMNQSKVEMSVSQNTNQNRRGA